MKVRKGGDGGKGEHRKKESGMKVRVLATLYKNTIQTWENCRE